MSFAPINWALIQNGVVFNIIYASQDFINTANLTDFSGNPIEAAINISMLTVDIGYTYDGMNFYPPVDEGN